MKEVQLFALRKEFWKLKQLVSEGANVNDTSNEDNPARYSPLIFGAISGSADILILLIINGASINYQVKNSKRIVFLFYLAKLILRIQLEEVLCIMLHY